MDEGLDVKNEWMHLDDDVWMDVNKWSEAVSKWWKQRPMHPMIGTCH